jgi:hypothetical protein
MTSTGKAICCATAGSATAAAKQKTTPINTPLSDRRRPDSLRLAKPSIADDTIAEQYPKITPTKRKHRGAHGKNSF